MVWSLSVFLIGYLIDGITRAFDLVLSPQIVGHSCSLFLSQLAFWSRHLCELTHPMEVQPQKQHLYLWASVTHLRMDLYLQHRTRKQLVNPFSLRLLICSYLLQQPEKSQGIFSSLLPIDPTLRNLPRCLNTIDPPPLNDRLSHQCIKGLDELKFHFRQLVPVIFTLSFNSWKHTLAGRNSESVIVWLRGETRDKGETL